MSTGSEDNAPQSPTLRGYIKAESIAVPRELMARSTGHIISSAVLPFAFIVLAMAVGRMNFDGWMTTVAVAFLPILAAQRCLQTLVHDLSHLLFSRSRRANDFLGNLIIAGFIGMRIQNYWRVHAGHHAANGSADDPEYVDIAIVSARGGLGRFVMSYVAGLEAAALISKYYFRDPSPDEPSGHGNALSKITRLLSESWHVAVCQILLLYAFAGISDSWYLYVVWLYVALTWSPMLSKLRFLVEHPSATDLTITSMAPLWERIYFAPYNFNYHFEHHLWPSLPPYQLKGAHKKLRDEGYFDRHPEYVGGSYLTTLVRKAAS